MDISIYLRDLRVFLILWFSQSLSQIGSAMTALALVIYAYRETGSATAVTLLTASAAIPYTLVSFFAGPLVDRLPKKALMLTADSAAACCTLAVLLLHAADRLEIPFLYGINFGIGLANAFQRPASNVAVTLLVKPEYYTRVGGFQSLADSVQAVAAPLGAATLLAFGGLASVLAVDLAAFVFAFAALALAVLVPERRPADSGAFRFFAECREGWRFLRRNRPLLTLLVFMAQVNLLASLSYFSILPAMILARTGGSELMLGIVNAVIGAGGIAGGCLVALLPPPRNRVRVIFLGCAVSFLAGDPFFAAGRSLAFWIPAALLGNLPLPFVIACDLAIFRAKVPVAMQGRIFALRSALQFGTMPLGYLAGGLLADRVFEPFMAGGSAGAKLLEHIVGGGPGSGMAVMFLLSGTAGVAASLLFCRVRGLASLNAPEQFTAENPGRDLA
ncbi:MFS transporter [Victivallis lenta]|uniref:MFS transporter n=1 Tax=Victivallis lenta TaxID=2606640 RepID=UPI003AB4B53D